MINLLNMKRILLSLVASASALCASEDRSTAANVIERAHTSIARIEEGKIYLKPEKLCLEQGKIYIEDIEGAGFAIPVIFSSEGRPYMQVDESFVFNSWKCECGTWNHKWDNPTHCRRCDRPR